MDEEKTVKEVKEEKCLDRIKAKVKNFGEGVLKVVSDNPMLIIPLISAAFGLVSGAANMVSGAGNDRYEKCLCEDDVTGEDFLLKHPLNNDEILELGSRMVDGETKGSALAEMDLLRKDKRRK